MHIISGLLFVAICYINDISFNTETFWYTFLCFILLIVNSISIGKGG